MKVILIIENKFISIRKFLINSNNNPLVYKGISKKCSSEEAD